MVAGKRLDSKTRENLNSAIFSETAAAHPRSKLRGIAFKNNHAANTDALT
jgi:hypothetical protein